jgi:hypothetical protein
MADKKISALTGASLPLGGTEVLPIVQSGSTKNVATNDLTVKNVRSNATTGVLQVAGPGAGATRTMTVPDANFTVARTDAAQTFTGSQIIGNGSTYTALGIDSSAAGGGELLYRTGGSLRWAMSKADAETGSDAGGNLYIFRYTDAGGYAGNPIGITRSNGNVRLEGNLVIGNSGRGIDFSATTEGSGTMTSELFSDYEEGTWTPTMTSAAGTTTVNSSVGGYTKIGDHVFVVFQIDYNTDATVGTSNFTIGGLPFTSRSTFNSRGFVTSSNWTNSDLNDGYIIIGSSVTSLLWADRLVVQSSRTNAILLFCADYFAA